MLLLIVLALRKQIRPAPWIMLLVVLIEVLGINALIALNGAASNPYNAILLVPLVLGLMLLPYSYAAILLLISIIAQLFQLTILPEHSHHGGQMLAHFYAMVGSFILTAILMTAVVWYFKMQLARREKSIQDLREKQLRDEQLLAIGTAAAQLSHDVATPVQSIRLLLEEVLEQNPQVSLIHSLEQQFQRVEAHLKNWRDVANDVREKRQHLYSIYELWQSLQHLLAVARPEASINWQASITNMNANSSEQICADRTLLPALTSVIINACEAASISENKWVNIEFTILNNKWHMQIENHTNVNQQQDITLLGNRLMSSQHGHGIGAVLSNATIEKFAGEVRWHGQNSTIITTVILPLVESSNHA